MGNFRFKLSDMMPNAWFYKLREIGSRSRTHPNPSNHKPKQQPTTATSAKTKETHHCYPRKSYHFTGELFPIPTETLHKSFDPPRKSSKQRSRKRKSSKQSSQKIVVSSSVPAGCSCRPTLRTKPDSLPEYSASYSSCSSSGCSPEPEFRSDSVLATAQTQCFDKTVSLANGVVEDKPTEEHSDSNLDDLDKFPVLELPPIITKPTKFNETEKDATKTEQMKKSTNRTTNSETSSRIAMKEQRQSNGTLPIRKSCVNSGSGVRLRVNSPRLASRRIQARARRSVSSSSGRRSLSDSFAVVKSSADPQRDFRESMVEMITENNIRGSKDLEDLLACYLSLNSEQYHDLIIKVFKQIWFDLSHLTLRLK